MTERVNPLVLHQRVLAAAQETDFVINRARLRGLGITRKQAAAQVAAGRWLRLGTQTFAVRTGELSHAAQCWATVWEMGVGVALIDGVDALRLAGLKGWSDDVVHVTLVHRHTASRRAGVTVHKVIRRVEGEAAGAGIPRTRPAIAAVRAAHWAVSDRAAATILAMAVQQRLVTGPQLAEARRVVRGRTRRAFIAQVVADVADGAHSLHELDFAAECRARGLPTPTRQRVKEGRDGRVYLDVYFEGHGLVVEIDGAGHLWAMAGVADALRANQLVIDGDRVLRINVLGIRVDLDATWTRSSRRCPPSGPRQTSPAIELRERSGGRGDSGRGRSAPSGGSAIPRMRGVGGGGPQPIHSLQPWCRTSQAIRP